MNSFGNEEHLDSSLKPRNTQIWCSCLSERCTKLPDGAQGYRYAAISLIIRTSGINIRPRTVPASNILLCGQGDFTYELWKVISLEMLWGLVLFCFWRVFALEGRTAVIFYMWWWSSTWWSSTCRSQELITWRRALEEADTTCTTSSPLALWRWAEVTLKVTWFYIAA